MDERDAGEWIPMAEAAARLGTTADAIRKRISRGGIEGRKDKSGRWFVRMPGEGEEPPASTATVRAYVGRLEEENRWLRSRLDAALDDARSAHERADTLTASLLRALAPPPDMDGGQPSEGPDTRPDTRPTTPRRSLWSWLHR